MPWYTWVFSGIGVPLAIGFLGWVWHRRNKQLAAARGQQAVITNAVTELVETSPSADEILRELHKLTPYERHLNQGKYSGLPVLWRLQFDFLQNEHNRWAIFGREELGGNCAAVLLRVPELPPELKVAPRGTVLWVRGVIGYVDNGMVTLRESEILLIQRINRKT